jgi:hypothetical protein
VVVIDVERADLVWRFATDGTLAALACHQIVCLRSAYSIRLGDVPMPLAFDDIGSAIRTY